MTRTGRVGRAAYVVLVALFGTILVVLGSGPAAAADSLTIRSVDTTEFPQVRISAIATGEAPDLGRFQLRENNQILNEFNVVPIGETDVPVGIVLAIDISGSMNQQGALDQAKAAAKQFVAQRLANDRIAIVAFGQAARVVVNFTADAAILNQAIDNLTAQGETALYDGVHTAASLFVDRKELQPNVVVLTDGRDTVSSATRQQAQAAALDVKAAVFSVGIQTGDFDPGPIQTLAQETGGEYFLASDPNALSQVYDQVQTSLQNQYEITYTSEANAPTLELTVSAPGVQDIATATVGSFSAGSNARPEVVGGTGGLSIFDNTLGKWIGVGLAVAAAALAAFAVIMIFVRDEGGLASRLQVYTDGRGRGDDGEEGSRFLQSDLVQQAVAATERFAERQGILPKVEQMLEKASLPLRAAEAMFFYLAVVVLATVAGLLLTRSLFGTLIVFALAALIPPVAVQFMAGRRQRRFMSQLPDTLQLLSGSLRAGYSLLQGVEAVSQEVDEPMGEELRRIIAETRLGRPLEESLQDAADRLGSDDFSWAVMAIQIQREVGGNLAELLDTVAETMIARERLRREVRALTAEGRISAIVLGILPIAMLLILWLINPEYIEVLFDDNLGRLMLVGGALLAGVGFYWLNKIVQIEI